METAPLYCDVSLPVPMDQPFTYALAETLRHRVKPGCRVLVPFTSRKLVGVVLRCHNDRPAAAPRDVLRLLDEEPVLDAELIALGRWMADYYCAPLGEALRIMTPLTGEIRRGRVYTLTDAGRDIVRQLVLGEAGEDPSVQILRLLEPRSLTASYLAKNIANAPRLLRALEKKGMVAAEERHEDRDPLRAPASKLRVEFTARVEGMKLRKAERELVAYLELHPGAHNLAEVEALVSNASTAARSLARRDLLSLKPEPVAIAAERYWPSRTLNPHQLAGYEQIRVSVEARKFETFLLRGVTGSGKTEVYMRSIDAALALGRGALLLVPEIALTPAVASQFLDHFGDRVAILHSAFTDSERATQWRRIRNGEAGVVVGTRSGVFAPVRDLGLIVVDEEHDGSYKQEETPRYNGRDLAIVRARAAGATVVLGSATPSLESRYNAARDKYRLIELPERIERRPMPEVELIDMRVEFLETRRQATFSRRLLEAIRGRLDAGEQVMLLLNRRGFSSFVTCRACGERVQCANCSLTLTYHRRDRRLLCHVCGYAERVPQVCPKCASEHIQFVGTGSERVEEELHQAFPEARIARMDRDTVTGRRHYETILHSFREHEYDILVGTQMIAKGHDIPNVTLVGVVSADVGLGVPDFRAAERTFQLLTQVAGRAGRGDIPGMVFLQTVNPEHYAIRFASAQDYPAFYEKELQFRRLMRYPPFSALANVLVRAPKIEDAIAMSQEVGNFLTPPPENVKVLGPAEAPVPKLKKEYRYQLLIKAASRAKLSEILHNLRRYALGRGWGPTALVVDVDPQSLM
jgi:primosomal protein N' (replication factor Y) (superfamily II helicase)